VFQKNDDDTTGVWTVTVLVVVVGHIVVVVELVYDTVTLFPLIVLFEYTELGCVAVREVASAV
jgi:hypothetical protein